MGIGDGDPGSGIFNLQTQPVWFDNMREQHAVFTLPMSHLEGKDLLVENKFQHNFSIFVTHAKVI